MNEININEIVKVESIGVIKQQLDKVENVIDEKIKNIPEQLEKIKKMSFIEQEDEKNDIKKYKQHLSKILNELEEKRKEIKKEINKPYEEFNEYYKNGVYLKLNDAISQINNVVNDIEILQKDEKECEIKEFVNQYINANNLQNIIRYEDIPISINLSSSMKSLKEQALTFIEKVTNDLKLIELEEYSSEIILEYNNNGFDFSKAKLDVIAKHKQLEEIQKQQQEVQLQIDDDAKIVEKVEEITTPKEILEDDELVTVSFKVTGTKDKIKKIKDLIIELGVEYE